MSSLTIVIPTKNEEAFLPLLLRSLLRQTYEPDAIIVADAESTDRTCDIARAFGATVVQGGLPGPGRNAGAKHASTDLILFLDADVVLKNPMFLEIAIREMEERGLDLATADVLPMSGTRVDLVLHGIYNRYVRLCGEKNAHAAGFCMLVRRELHEALSGFDETIFFSEDMDYAKRAVRIGRFGFLSIPVPVSTRRLDRDGRFNIACKFLLAELHLLTLGPIRSNKFNYTFGYKQTYGRKK